MNIEPVAYIKTDFKDKFGVPRQCGLVPGLIGEVIFEKQYSDPAAIRGIEEFSHLWLIWGFSMSPHDGRSLTVYPPRLGGRVKKGVFACRTPYRPNNLGLSSVKLEQVINDEQGIRLIVSGVDMVDGSPVYDIKPYIPYSDMHENASGGFSDEHKNDRIEVIFPDDKLSLVPADKRQALKEVLEQDPRAAYNKKAGFVYGLAFADMDIRFTADENRICVVDVIRPEGETCRVK